tara:strand:+ start:302 stop:478 length:177 start_codon:yes stop_codon:yes gene_type:complete
MKEPILRKVILNILVAFLIVGCSNSGTSQALSTHEMVSSNSLKAFKSLNEFVDKKKSQ